MLILETRKRLPKSHDHVNDMNEDSQQCIFEICPRDVDTKMVGATVVLGPRQNPKTRFRTFSRAGQNPNNKVPDFFRATQNTAKKVLDWFPDQFSFVHQRVVQWVKLKDAQRRRMWFCSHPNGCEQFSCARVSVFKGVQCGVRVFMVEVCSMLLWL